MGVAGLLNGALVNCGLLSGRRVSPLAPEVMLNTRLAQQENWKQHKSQGIKIEQDN